MTISLRPHHLLCLLTYVGKGYSLAFTANYDVIAGRLNAGEDIVIVDGPDDVCQPLLDDADPHCHNESVIERDMLAARDLAELLERPIAVGQQFLLDAGTLARQRVAFAQGQVRKACSRCEWASLCTEIAAAGYAGVKVQHDRC
ncbi:DUF1284 domain-containing protein [Devosia sp.]|uniref:DUF1284 domain-containing protein n=1 Tax=Devosia sp. TaxID=1871048 RepID=UPI003264B35F